MVSEALAVAPSTRAARAQALAAAEFSIGVCMDRYEPVLAALPPVVRPSWQSPLRRQVLSAAVSLPLAAARLARLRFSGSHARVAII
jgi:hypothetical protein